MAWMIKNFEHHYNNNRAPFGVYLHAAWFLKGEHYFEAYVKYDRFVILLAHDSI